MTPKFRLFVFCSLIAFFLSTENVKAGTNIFDYDSTTCCPPDSLRKLLEVDYPIFCVSWKVPSDSSCSTPQGFEVEWKRLTDSVWKHKGITYSSGTYITFCDSLYGCGIYQWRVRTKCNDSTYSNWVYGSKITVPCEVAKIKTQDYFSPLKTCISQEELADQAGTNSPAIGRYERDEMKPSIDAGTKMANILGVSLDWLVGNKDAELNTTTINRIQDIQKLNEEDQSLVFRTIDALLRNAKARKTYA